MKAPLAAILISCALGAPALAFAQADNGGPTHADVIADLARLEQAGFRPIAEDASYPDDIQAAEAKVAAAQGQSPTASSVGGAPETGTTQAGVPLARNNATSQFPHQ